MADLEEQLLQWESEFKQHRYSQPISQSQKPPDHQIVPQGLSAMENQNSASSPLDDLLSQVKAEFDQSKPLPQLQSNSQSESNNPQLQELISKVKTEFAKKRKNYQSGGDNHNSSSTTSSSAPLDDLLTQVRAEFDSQPPSQLKSNQSRPSSNHRNSSTQNDEDFFATVQSKFEQKKQTQASQSYEQSVNEVRLEEQRKQRKQRSLVRQAKEWLSNLDPHSEEGLWFEEFAYSYPSRLEAAIDYVEALKEVRY